MRSKTVSSKDDAKKKSKNQLRRKRAKLQKQGGLQSTTAKQVKLLPKNKPKAVRRKNSKGQDDYNETDPNLINMYKDIFQKFEILENAINDDEAELTIKPNVSKFENINENNDDENDKIRVTETENEEEIVKDEGNNDLIEHLPSTETVSINDKLSKRQFKKKYSIPLYVLKSESRRPEMIDWIDATSSDPRLHVYLKTLPNSVPIPIHWQTKRSFLSTKRCVERPPFELPPFIKDTGILEMRNTDGNEDQSTLKQRMRERVQPKAGQLDIDYEKLYDAFFIYQKKPPLLKFGELYTENTNNNDLILNEKLSHLKVGVLSSRLKMALGMLNEEGNVINTLPPWYYKMQEIGPPPSYPFMKIDASGRIFINTNNEVNIGPPIITKRWGTLVNDLNGAFNKSKNIDENKREEKVVEDKNKFTRSQGDILINSFGDDPTKLQGSTSINTQKMHDKPGNLYQILKTTESGDKNSIFGSKTTSYKL